MALSGIVPIAVAVVVLAAVASVAGASGAAPPVQPVTTPVSAMVVQVCQGCHGPEIITQKGRSKDEWSAVVQTMVERGAMASEQDLQAIVDYLATTYPADQKAAGH